MIFGLGNSSMGLMDGAVNGMASRLVQVGYSPEEAFCLGQSAYIKEHKRAAGVPPTVMKRQDVSREINLTLARLGSFPMGVEAHRQRIILWEKVFGRGSWHEPIDPDEIYINQAPPHTQTSSPESRKTASNLSEQHKEFKFILPGQDGMYSDAYAQVLVKAAESELYQRALNDGYTIAADSVQVQIIDIDEMRQQGHDMQAIGMGESTYLAAHVTGAGARN